MGADVGRSKVEDEVWPGSSKGIQHWNEFAVGQFPER
jgi:hypothetical protein